jgi:hypothetical protein
MANQDEGVPFGFWLTSLAVGEPNGPGKWRARIDFTPSKRNNAGQISLFGAS